MRKNAKLCILVEKTKAMNQGWVQVHVLVFKYRFSCTWSLKYYLYLEPKYLKNTKYVQVQTSTLYLIKSYILYIDSSKLCVDIRDRFKYRV